jgi:hypothetical protein
MQSKVAIKIMKGDEFVEINLANQRCLGGERFD